jgi:hypothetical protein
MASRHAAALAIAAALVLTGAPALAQSGSTTPPGGPITLAALPDLTVTKATVQISCVGGKSVTAVVTATVRNLGVAGAADFSKIPQQVGVAARWDATSGNNNLESLLQTANPQLSIAPPIKPGETRSFSLVIAGIPKHKATATAAPEYSFAVIADPKKAIGESNEGNNELIVFAMDPCPK